MTIRIIPGSEKLAHKIRQRRIELGLTIEEAASRAGVGTKTWSRYEAGASIRKDKSKGICKALNWYGLFEEEDDGTEIEIDEYRNLEAWSPYLEEEFGISAAKAFAIGSDILYDYIQEDFQELSSKPKGTHLGQLEVSWLEGELPEQFRMNYDYDFLYKMKCELLAMRQWAKAGSIMTAHSVLQELLFYLCSREAEAYFELKADSEAENEYAGAEEYTEWIYDLFGDADLITCLYSDIYIQPDNSYYFSNWSDLQFYMKPEKQNK
jgi:transcriptional regulator with XRE-family HTH domain